MDKNRNLELIAWMAGGVVLGGIVALLLAPEAGARTRQKLAEQAGQGGKSLLGSGQDLIAKGRDLFERGREIVEETAELLERGRQIAEKKIEDRF